MNPEGVVTRTTGRRHAVNQMNYSMNPEHMPERKLWAEVIRIAMQDLAKPHAIGETAQLFFSDENAMFARVCSFLGLPQDVIADEAHRRMFETGS
jgi:hypothetical protein